MNQDDLNKSADELEFRNGQRFGLKYTDKSYWPFTGPNFGKLLYQIDLEFWKKYVEDNDFIPKEKLSEHANQYQTIKGKLVSYAKKRIKRETSKRRSEEKKGMILLTNGKINKFHDPSDPIPRGWKRGSVTKGRPKPKDQAYRDKISAGLKRYYQTEKGKADAKGMREKLLKIRMKKHTKIYMEHFGYGTEDFIPCQICGGKAVDVHHIVARGQGGTYKTETIDNLMAIERELHVLYGDKKKYMDFLYKVHENFMNNQTAYITVNPHHKAFDEMLKLPKYKELVKWYRQRI